jgi:hypothetical protein
MRWGVALVLVVVLALYAVAPAMAQGAWMEVRFLRVLVTFMADGDVTVGDDLTVTDDATITGDASVGGAATVTGAASAASMTTTGAMTAGTGLTLSNGDLTVADDLKIAKQGALTVTNGAAFTVTGTYQPITAAGAVTPTITMGAAGDVVVLVNTANQTITIADASTTMLSAAWAGTQYDTLTLICDGTNWLEVSRSAN